MKGGQKTNKKMTKENIEYPPINCIDCGNEIKWWQFSDHCFLGWRHKFKCPSPKPKEEIKKQNIESINRRIDNIKK